MKTWIVVPFAMSAFLASALLFSAEPMIGKMALPTLGGTPAVWNTCLLYFQAVLLAGYLFALLLGRLGSISAKLPLLLIAAAYIVGFLAQPIELGMESLTLAAQSENPTIPLLLRLIRSTGLPLVLVAATTPLVQYWFSRTSHVSSRDPYFLYAASNAGSLLALLAYPLLVEPRWNLSDQPRMVQWVFGAIGVLLVICSAFGSGRGTPVLTSDPPEPSIDSTKKPTRLSWMYWVVLSAIPSSWLMGVTTFLTTNLAPMPLLWLIPLAVFLLASILAFARSTRKGATRFSRLFPWLAMSLVLVQLAGFVHAVWIPLHLLTFFLGCLVCNLELVRLRPEAGKSTSFYVAIALGGLLGGAFNVLAAPLLFGSLAEYPLAVLCGCFCYPAAREPTASTRARWKKSIVVSAIVLACAFPLTHNVLDVTESLVGPLLVVVASGLGFHAMLKAGEQPLRFAMVVGAVLFSGLGATDPAGVTRLRSRDFYGIVRVTEDPRANCRRLLHGGTLHGEQSLDPALSREPRTYFTRSGPIGDLFQMRRERSDGGDGNIAVVGLGVGTLASHARPGERWTFYELDPTVVRIARDPSFFTYLRDTRAGAQEFFTGDARLRIREAPNSSLSLIVLDAFGADAVPVHLLTREAIRLYLSKLAPGGLLVFNITNGYLDLEPVIGLQASDADLACRVRRDVRVTPEERQAGKLGSIWAVLARSEADLGQLANDARWTPPRIRAGARPWTDDYSDLASYLMILRRWSSGR